MSAAALPYAITALVPVLIGPLPVDSQSMTVPLCNGGTLTIPLGDSEAPMDNRQCHPSGCHAGTSREKAKRTI
ncbi:MAG: hypothetical protein U0995_08590 [Erythrobacter sp.]|nr:hypothetical protein [Erythrobacter sp.]